MQIKSPAVYLLLLPLLLCCCNKFREKLDLQNNESGIIKVVKAGVNITEAQIDETITVYAKIGDPSAVIKIFVSDVEAQVLTHGKGNSTLLTSIGEHVQVPMDTFNITVPKAAHIGPGNIYFSVNGLAKPALPFVVKRPNILIPNQVTVIPYLFSYSDSVKNSDGAYEYIFPVELKDGPSRQAVVNVVKQLTYDRNTQTFYFIDFQQSDNSLRIRMIKNGMVTTIAGGGDDYFATTGSKLKLGITDFSPSAANTVDMKPGPDGKLYFKNLFTVAPATPDEKPADYSLIQSLDPATGKVTILAGNNKRSIDAYYSNTVMNYRGLEDGPADSAMITSPNGLTFDKNGNLYFLDMETLLRVLKPDGSIKTVMGKVSREVFDFEDADGVTYHPVLYTNLMEHSDGFGEEVRFYNATNMVMAGNGKLYVLSNGAGWGTNIVEINLDTREASTIVGLPEGQRSDYETGTFKEVGLPYTITTYDTDFDGNIVFGFTTIYKMDLRAETIAVIAGGPMQSPVPPEYKSQRAFMQDPHPGNNCILARPNRIVFDQFGDLYVGYDNVCCGADVRIVKIAIGK